MSELKEVEAPKPVRVSVSLQTRESVGDGYGEHVQLSISVTDDAKPGEKAGEAIDRVYALTEKKLNEKMKEAVG